MEKINNEEQSPDQIREELTDEAQAPGAVSPLTQAIVEERYDNQSLLARLSGYRTTVDSLFRTVENMKPIPAPFPHECGRYVSIAVTCLQGARQFLGKILQEKGAAYPYKNKPEEVADQGKPLDLPENLLDAVTFVRQRIQDQITEFLIYIGQISPVGPIDFICQNEVLARLLEAKMMLGEIYGVVAVAKKSDEKESALPR
jgi:hypothetical protein